MNIGMLQDLNNHEQPPSISFKTDPMIVNNLNKKGPPEGQYKHLTGISTEKYRIAKCTDH